MPAYNFASDDGDVIERTFRMSEVPRSVTVDGKVYKRQFTAPSVVGMNWSGISRQLAAENKEAGDRGRSYWDSRSPRLSK